MYFRFPIILYPTESQCIDFGYRCPLPVFYQPYQTFVEICVYVEDKLCCYEVEVYFYCDNIIKKDIVVRPDTPIIEISYELEHLPISSTPLNIIIYGSDGNKRFDVMNSVPLQLSDTLLVDVSSLDLGNSYYVVYHFSNQLEAVGFFLEDTNSVVQSLTASPNPGDQPTISVFWELKQMVVGVFDIDLYDGQGNFIQNIRTGGVSVGNLQGDINVDISNLNIGLHYVVAFVGGQAVKSTTFMKR